MSHRVLHVIRRLDVVGGAERIVAELVRHDANHDVLVFDGGESFFDLGDGQMIRAKSLSHALRVCLSLRDRYDTFHLHLFPAIYFASLLGKKSIIHEHNTHNSRRDLIVFRPLEWLIYRRARSVLAISEATKTALRNWVGSGPKVDVLLNFVAPRAQETREDTTPKLTDAKQVLMVASFTMQKRQDLLIQAFASLPEGVHLTFAGTGPTMEDCKALVEELCLSHRITFLGAVTDVGALYKQVDLCVLVSHWEGFGLVAIEAAQYGVPTLVSDVEGLRDICPHPSLLYKGEDPIILGNHILRILNDEEETISQNELLDFSKSYNISEYIQRLTKIYAH